MLPAFASSRRLPPGKSEARALAGTRLELCTRWPTGADAARVHRCSKTSTRPFFAPLSRAIPGRVRFHDFCRSMFQRALPWTTRTSRTSGIRGRDGCLCDRSSPFDRGQPPKVRRVRGRGSPNPRRSLPGLLPRETSPQPRSLQTPRVAVIVRLPAWRRRGGRAKPPAPRKLASMGGGRAVRRPISAKRSDVHQPEGPSVVRPFENGEEPSGGGAASTGRSSAFFTAGGPREGRSHGAGSSAFRIRERQSRSVID